MPIPFSKSSCLLIISLVCFFPTEVFSAKEPTIPVADQQVVQEIYQNLQYTIGDKRQDWPKVKVWSITDRVASFVPLDNTIYIDQQTLDICKTFGEKYKDALAFIIGHELTHFYQEHQWQEVGFVSHFLVNKANFQEHLEHEKQADIYGTFIAQQSGYQTIRLVPSILDKIYQAYQLKSTATQEYPSLNNRKKLAEEACHLAADLVDVYQTANYAMVLGKYEEAHFLYDYVRQSLQFKELYFNLGMNNLLQYYHAQPDLKLSYDFEIDPSIPITRNDQTRHPKALLKAAKSAFNKILTQYDAQYFPAQLQLITVLDWQADKTAAIKQITQLTDNYPPKNQASFFLTVGNFYARNEQPELARDFYQRMIKLPELNPYLKQLGLDNLQYLKTKKSAKQQPPQRPSLRIEKGIDNIPSLTLFKKYKRTISIKDDMSLQTSVASNSYLYQLNFKGDLLKIQVVEGVHTKSKKGIHIGSTDKDIKIVYPKSQLGKIRYANGFYLIHYEKGLVFKCNQAGIVKEWGVFTI